MIALLRIIIRAVSVPDDLHVKLVAKLGFIPKLIDILSVNDDDISKHVVLILINLAACDSNCVDLIMNVDGHKKLIELIDSSNTLLAERCLWALGNIAGDKSSLREALLLTDLPAKVSNLLAKNIPLPLLRMACWVASYLCCENHYFSRVQSMVKPLNQFLHHSDFQVLLESLCAISKMIQDKFARAEITKQLDVPRILELTLSESLDISIPATYIVGCICAGDYTCAALVVENGGIKILSSLFKNPSVSYIITKYTCWAIGNLCLSCITHLNLLLDYGVIKRAVEIINSSPDYSVFLFLKQ